MNKTLTRTYAIDFMFQSIKILPKYPGKCCLFFWQYRPEKPSRPLTLSKDMVWYGLTLKKETLYLGH
jgi:hypothetical protein